MKTLNPLALGYAGAITSAIIMLFMGSIANLGFYTGAAMMMSEWHMFFSLTAGGIVSGMIEAAIISFIILYIFGVVYNMFVTKK